MPDQEPHAPDAAASLATFGEDLRREREIRGISLKEISDATKISKRFLEALERNDHRTLPAPVFTRGFVREYARYVGLNAEEMVNRYNFAAANDDRIEKPPQLAKYPETLPRDISPKPPAKRDLPSAFAFVDRNAIFAVFIVIALAAVAYWAVERKRAERESENENTAPIPVTTRAAAAPAPTSVIETKPPVDDATLRLEVDVVANSWVVLEADGKSVFSDEMRAGDHQSFQANEQFRFRTIGNAAGLQLTLNGERVPTLGEDGEVVKNRTFDRKTLDELRAALQDPS